MQGRDKPGGEKPSPYDGVWGRIDLDGEGGVVVAVQDLTDYVEDVLHAPGLGEVEDVVPMHAVAVFT